VKKEKKVWTRKALGFDKTISREVELPVEI
jgi:hypothetical protein